MDDQRRLGCEDAPAVGLFDIELHPRRDAIGVGSPEHVQPHDVPVGVVQEERDDLERHHRGKPSGQIAKQRREIAVRRDGVGHFEEQAQLIAIAQVFLANGRVERQDRHLVSIPPG